jgi:hypothetical protein
MVVALGWGPLATTIGGIAAALGLGTIFGLRYGIDFAITVALPAWWLGHLVLLGRPVDTNTAMPAVSALEWYPVGRVLLWIAGLSMLTTTAALLMLGTDAEAINGALRAVFQQFTQDIGAGDAASSGEPDRLINAMVVITPVTGAISAMARLTLNLWLAAKITATSGRLHRPWPDLKSAALPPMTIAALCVAIALSFAGGLFAILAQIVAAALVTGYALTGFAVLHTLTLALKSRALWLGITYAIVVMLVWPVVAVAVLGLADAVFGFRERYLRGRPPPLPAS